MAIITIAILSPDGDITPEQLDSVAQYVGANLRLDGLEDAEVTGLGITIPHPHDMGSMLDVLDAWDAIKAHGHTFVITRQAGAISQAMLG
jgi:hypothetical protein